MSFRILVIEDNPTNLELTTYLLRAFGHTPIIARDGEAGLALARQSAPDLIVCDLHMPRLDGFGVLRAVKADAALRSIPIVALTASAMMGDRDTVLAAGFDAYLSKPIVPETFVEEIVALVRRGRV